jgi:hypothetical protein
MSIKTFKLSPLPQNAFHPEDLWLEIMIPGNWTPGNTGNEEVWDFERMSKVQKNTKARFNKGIFPVLNKDHHFKGPASGLIDDIRVNEDTGALEAKVAYLTPDIQYGLSSGEWPYRSVEIAIEDKKEYMVGLAFTSYPAVEGMKLSPMSFNKNANDTVSYYSKHNYGGLKMSNGTKTEEKPAVNLDNNSDIDKVDSTTENSGKNKTMDFSKSPQFVQMQEQIKALSATIEKGNSEINNYKNLVEDRERKLRKTELKQFSEKHPIPGFQNDLIVDLLYSIETGSKEPVKYSTNENKEASEMSSEIVKGIIEAYSASLLKLQGSQVDVDQAGANGKIFVSENSKTQRDFAALQIEDYAKNNNLNYVDALEELQKKGDIVYGK